MAEDWSLDYDILEYSLWMALLCECASCGKCEDLSSFDELLDIDPIEWSKAVTPVVRAAGWSSPEEGTFFCALCASK
jgi:hypothetical protein